MEIQLLSKYRPLPHKNLCMAQKIESLIIFKGMYFFSQAIIDRLLLDGNFPTKSSLKMEQTVLHFIMTAKKHKHSQNKNSFCVV